jgi:hypothetical protein
MFATVERSHTLDSLLLRGVTTGPDGREVPIRDAAMLAPFDQCRLTTAMSRARSQRDGEARLQAMLDDCLVRYEAARQRGAHDGPPLKAIRVYDAHWELDPDARNVETPERSTLVSESGASAAVRTTSVASLK